MAEPGFTVKVSTTSGRRLDVAGELDLAASSELRAALADLVDEGGDVTIDLSAITFIDSTALTILVHMHNELAASGARLIVTDPSPVVVRTLQLAGLVSRFAISGLAD